MNETDHIDLDDKQLQPCLGGFCGSRDKCGHYWSKQNRSPVERLCASVETPVAIHRIECREVA